MLKMRSYQVIYLTSLLIFFLALYTSTVKADQESSCFQFTWLGPRYTNRSEFLNATCEDATRLSQGVPCVSPLVASYDGSWPDVDYIYRNHFDNASCYLVDGDVCAKFTYYFDNHVENATYMCTRALYLDGGSITSGCFEQEEGGFKTRVCFCKPIPGGMPCNSANFNTLSIFSLVFLVIISYID